MTTLQDLEAGNRRFAAGEGRDGAESVTRRRRLARHQAPGVAVLGCADSRVPPELVLDQGLGDLFTVRVAGSVATPAVVGSLEYAVEHLGVRQVVVLGHRGCGAVAAAVDHADGEPMSGALGRVLRPILPAVRAARRRGEVSVDAAVHENVARSVAALTGDAGPLGQRIRSGEVSVVGAVYDLESGRVAFPAQGLDWR